MHNEINYQVLRPHITLHRLILHGKFCQQKIALLDCWYRDENHLITKLFGVRPRVKYNFGHELLSMDTVPFGPENGRHNRRNRQAPSDSVTSASRCYKLGIVADMGAKFDFDIYRYFGNQISWYRYSDIAPGKRGFSKCNNFGNWVVAQFLFN